MDLKLLRPTWPKLSTSLVHVLQWHGCTKLLIWDFKLKQKVCHDYFCKIHYLVNLFFWQYKMEGLDVARPKPGAWHKTVLAGEQESQSYASPGMESINYLHVGSRY